VLLAEIGSKLISKTVADKGGKVWSDIMPLFMFGIDNELMLISFGLPAELIAIGDEACNIKTESILKI
tara:strand:+ start:18 stop:221 length:204 start_codon:yes stop_codon:yes gene_type:complete